MKNYEELARLHVEEAIQVGLRSQAVHRARSGGKNVSTPVSVGKQHSGGMNAFLLLFQIIGKIFGG